jgi:hypothetical protein
MMGSEDREKGEGKWDEEDLNDTHGTLIARHLEIGC